MASAGAATEPERRAVLSADIAGRPYVKAEHNRRLRALVYRTRTSIEFKHRYISAILKWLGKTWLTGYLPAFNVQMSLADAVARWLHQHPDFQAPTLFQDQPADLPQTPKLVIESPTTLRNHPPPDELEQMQVIARKFNVATRAERSRVLGRAGEGRVFAHERTVLASAGRADLARRVRWVSDQDGDGAGSGVERYCPEGRTRLIEVKTTNGWERTPFHIARNEFAVADERPTV